MNNRERKAKIEEGIDRELVSYMGSLKDAKTPETVKFCRTKIATLKEIKEVLFTGYGCICCRTIFPFLKELFPDFLKKYLGRFW